MQGFGGFAMESSLPFDGARQAHDAPRSLLCAGLPFWLVLLQHDVPQPAVIRIREQIQVRLVETVKETSDHKASVCRGHATTTDSDFVFHIEY